MLKKCSSTLAMGVLVVSGALSAMDLPSQIQFGKSGTFKIAEAEFMIQTYGENWKKSYYQQWKNLKADIKKTGALINGEISIGDSTGQIKEAITPLSDNEFELKCQLAFDKPTDLNLQCGTISVPVSSGTRVVVDGKELVLPTALKDLIVFNAPAVKKVEFKLSGGLNMYVSGDMGLAVQDNRKFDNKTFSFRFAFNPGSGKITTSELKLKFQLDMVKNQPVDIAAAATRGFVNNGKEGWTDQGPENDLRAMKSSTVKFHGLRFNIVDPAKNNGKAAIVIGGGEQQGFPHEVAVKLPSGNNVGAINLLHSSAWPPSNRKELGHIAVTYADGTSQTIPVLSQIDCGNWWNPTDRGNAVLAWKAENPMSIVGLYASSFKLNKTNPVSLTFKASDAQGIWMIVGVTFTDSFVHFDPASDKEKYIVPDKNWIPLDFNRQVVKNSPLDFSWVEDAPAGKYGRVISSAEGTLTFENAKDKRLRLYGANLCFSASYMDKGHVDKLVEAFVRNGYNTVRIHHHDTELLDLRAKDTLTFSPEKLDRLDYLVFKMKESGLYITTDFYTNRVFRKGDNVPECDFYSERQMKKLLPFSKAAMDNWKEFVRRWMSHKNPYTGLTWGEEPALYLINLVNEETLTANWQGIPSAEALYKAKFGEWCQANKITGAKAANSDHDFRRFLNEIQQKCLEEQLRFVKQELKLKMMITSLNFINDVPLALLRDKFDLVDNHSYFDHPSFVEEKWQLPFAYRQDSAIERQAVVPRNMMATRIFGKPFVVTEFNYCSPNIWRAEGGPLIGAYAALQDWDGLYRFAWSHSDKGIINQGPVVGFDAANDPMAQLSDRIATAMFVRGDIKAAANKISYQVSDDIFQQRGALEFPQNFQLLGLVAQIGSNIAGTKIPGVIPVNQAESTEPAAMKNKEVAQLWTETIARKTAESITGQLALNPVNKTFAVKSAGSETVTLPEGSLQAGVLGVKAADCFQTVAAISLDKQPLAQSRSILLLHLTNVANTKQLFGNEKFKVVKNQGQLPLLVYRGKATVELTVGQPFKVTALALDGSPKGEIAGTHDNGVFRFTADTGALPGGVMAYHLTR